MSENKNPNYEGVPTNRPNQDNGFSFEFTTNNQNFKAGDTRHFDELEIKIGRLENCQIRFGEDCNTISRHHATIKNEGDNRFVLHHHSQSQPTLVNGTSVTNSRILGHRDSIQFSNNGPKVLFLAPNATSSNGPTEAAATNRGGTAETARNTPEETPTTTARASINDQSENAQNQVNTSRVEQGNCSAYAIEFNSRTNLHHKGKRVVINTKRALIGRDKEASIKFGDDCRAISSKHAVIECQNGDWILRHLSQTNSTYVNGDKIINIYALTGGEEISFAKKDGHSLFFLPSGSSNKSSVSTDRVGQPSGGNVTNRVNEILRKSNRGQYALMGIMGGLLLLFSIGSFWYYQDQQNKTALAEAERQRIEQTIADKEAAEQSRIFPLTEYAKYVFFGDGTALYTLSTGRRGEFNISGSSFFTNNKRLVTARHVVRPLEYPRDEENCRIVQSGVSLDLNINFLSRSLNERATEPRFTWQPPEPTHIIPRTGSSNLYHSACNGLKTCLQIEDWAVSTPAELSKIQSPIEVDRDFAMTLTQNTEMVALGYRNGVGSNPQRKDIILSEIAPALFDSEVYGRNRQDVFKVANPTFGPGDSGGPVFAYNENKRKWVVVGIISGLERLGETNSDWGIIVPIYAIPQNLLE